MRDYSITPTLTYEYILSRVSQEEIFSRYLGIQVNTNSTFCAPSILRDGNDDKSPSCSFKWSMRRVPMLILRDFAGYFWGDCFNLVEHIYRVNSREALHIIAKDFGLIGSDVKYTPIQHEIQFKVHSKPKIEYKKRAWMGVDKKYWLDEHKIGLDLLNYFKVYPIDTLWMNGEVIYTFRKDDPLYLYDYTKDNYKAYLPFRKKGDARFYCYTSCLQGWSQLPEQGELLIITKSYKDVIQLYQLGYAAIAPQSETQPLKAKWCDNFKQRFKKTIILYDNDVPGRKASEERSKESGFPFTFIPDLFGKDTDDLVKDYGIEFAKEVLEDILKLK